jgi:hypothetical protein
MPKGTAYKLAEGIIFHFYLFSFLALTKAAATAIFGR